MGWQAQWPWQKTTFTYREEVPVKYAPDAVRGQWCGVSPNPNPNRTQCVASGVG